MTLLDAYSARTFGRPFAPSVWFAVLPRQHDRLSLPLGRDDRHRVRSREREREPEPDRELERQRAAERKEAELRAIEADRAYRDRLAKLEKRERWAGRSHCPAPRPSPCIILTANIPVRRQHRHRKRECSQFSQL